MNKEHNDIDSLDASDPTVPLTPLEARVFQLAWSGMKHVEIASLIQRHPRSVSRMLKQISAKLEPLNPHFLRLRLEDELLARIPSMTDRDLIAALRLYLPVTRPTGPKASTPVSNRDVQAILREVLSRDDADATQTR